MYHLLKQFHLISSAENLNLEIIYEDEDVLVVYKPRGMVVHPAPGHTTGTLVNGLMHQIKDLSGINGVLRPGIVHRIDKDTSGLLMVAKNDIAHVSLVDQLVKKLLRVNILHLYMVIFRMIKEQLMHQLDGIRKKDKVWLSWIMVNML